MIILLKQKLNQRRQLYSFEEEFMMAVVIMIVSCEIVSQGSVGSIFSIQ